MRAEQRRDCLTAGCFSPSPRRPPSAREDAATQLSLQTAQQMGHAGEGKQDNWCYLGGPWLFWSLGERHRAVSLTPDPFPRAWIETLPRRDSLRECPVQRDAGLVWSAQKYKVVREADS